MGDPKLEKILYTMQMMLSEFGNPLTGLSLNYLWFYKLINYLGIIKVQHYFMSLIDFGASTVTDHKDRQIDGNHMFVFFALTLSESVFSAISLSSENWLRFSQNGPKMKTVYQT